MLANERSLASRQDRFMRSDSARGTPRNRFRRSRAEQSQEAVCQADRSRSRRKQDGVLRSLQTHTPTLRCRMVNPSSTASIYRWIVDDVVAKVKPEFASEGLEESVLDELRALWEQKLQQKGLLRDDEPRAGPSAPPALPPAPLVGAPGLNAGTQLLAALQNLQGMSQQQLLAITQNLKRSQPDSGFGGAQSSQPRPPQVPQRDGPADEGEDGEGAAEGDAEQAAEVEELSSDSEDEEDDEEAFGEHFCCCQFEKVSRAKSKWKIVLKEGVFHINGKDYLFKRANGEWIF